ncbi:hypothetical protein BDR26DRAFT_330958 [Obelidium mucronatum]|nr:hypothetical protein BDR26DRAFT_330958 [Obelidium mucronatum]
MINSIKSVSKFSADAQGIVHMDICKSEWNDQEIQENLQALLKAVMTAKPPKMESSKFVEAIVVSGPLLPGLKMPLRPFHDILG